MHQESKKLSYDCSEDQFVRGFVYSTLAAPSEQMCRSDLFGSLGFPAD